MTLLNHISRFFRNLFRARDVDSDLNDELASYLDMVVERKIERGIDPKQAFREALIEFGGAEQVKEKVREVRMSHYVETIARDIQYGLRVLIKNPVFTVVALLTLTLGIGANTAIFSVVNALLLRPLPYTDPGRLVAITDVSPDGIDSFVPGPHFFEWKEQGTTIQQIGAYDPNEFTLTGGGEAEKLDGNTVTAQFLPMLGVKPLLGRLFIEEEDRPGAPHTAIISHSLWQRRFSSDPRIIGQSITLDDEQYVVVGVLPADFKFIGNFDVWTPKRMNPEKELSANSVSILNVIARLKSGVTREQAQSDLETIRVRYEKSKSASQLIFDGQVRMTSLQDKLVGDTRRPLLIMLGAVGLILLIACANVANLMLSRGAARRKEFSIRAALGAGRSRLIQQMLVESLVLSAMSAIMGLALAFGITKGITVLATEGTFGDLSNLASINIDFKVLGFTLIIALFTGVLFGLAPAVQLSRPNLNDALKEGGRGSGRHHSGLRRLLLITEVTMAIVLLVGAGLLIRSFVNLLDVNPGYKSDNLLTMRVSLSALRYPGKIHRSAFYDDALQRIAVLPGVESVGAINHLPLTNYMIIRLVTVAGRPVERSARNSGVPVGIVNNEYFRTMNISLRSGRTFNDSDNSESQRVAILSEALAKSLFPGEDPLGRELNIPEPGKPLPIVAGIVSDIRHQGLDKEITPEIYFPYKQMAPGSLMLAIRTTKDPVSIAAAVRGEIRAIDNGLPVYEVKTMEQRLAGSVAPRRFNLILLGSFAFLALSLAAVGVYGVIAYAVTQRTQEIGIRMALGARSGDVLRLLIGQGMLQTAIGIVLGLTGAWALTRLMKTLLFGVSATDPFTFVGVSVLLMVVALLACYVPARRAARIDPMQALRQE